MRKQRPLGQEKSSFQCSHANSETFAWHLLITSRSVLKFKVQNRIANAVDRYSDRCSTLSRSPYTVDMAFALPCLLKCDARYNADKKNSQGFPGHRVSMRLCQLFKLLKCLDQPGSNADREAHARKLLNQRDTKYHISAKLHEMSYVLNRHTLPWNLMPPMIVANLTKTGICFAIAPVVAISPV